MRDFPRRLTIAAFVALTVGAGCDDDETTDPTTGSLEGRVSFEGTWPTSGEVQVSLYATLSPPWVPMGPPEQATGVITGEPSTYDFRFDGLEFAEYAGIYVSWRDPADVTSAQLIGMYWEWPDSVGVSELGLPLEMPSGVAIDREAPMRTGLDFTADLDLLAP